jgi:hypothetical protein
MSNERLKLAVKSLYINNIQKIYVSDSLLSGLPDNINTVFDYDRKHKTIKILDKNDINKINTMKNKVSPEFEELFLNNFIGQNIINNVVTTCNNMFEFSNKNRNIKLYSSQTDTSKYIKHINLILNMFDQITGKQNKYTIKIYLSNLKKKLCFTDNVIKASSINTGSTLAGAYITLWRKEELNKVLIHELVHYLHLDIYAHQNNIKYIYDDINLDNDLTNPNEAYTEYTAIILYIYWIYKTTKTNMSLKQFIKKRLLIELGWSLYQIAKVLKYFKCYSNYEDLFTKKCEFRQRTSVLSYFLLKTYFLFNSKMFMDCINFNNDEFRFSCIKKIDLNNDEFAKAINNNIGAFNFNDDCMRMSCLG